MTDGLTSQPNNDTTPGHILIAAGGTGGHVAPASALARTLLARGYQVTLLTDTRTQAFPDLGDADAQIDRVILPVKRLRRTPKSLIGGTWSLIAAYAKAHAIYSSLKPTAVIGFGGYPSVPPLLAAAHRRIPTIIHEQNAVMGLANRLLAGRVSAIGTTFSDTRRLTPRAKAKAKLVGNPVRAPITHLAGRAYEAPDDSGPVQILVTGGSQGAAIFSDVLPQALAKLPEALRTRLHLVQQCRPEDLERVQQTYREQAIDAQLSTFFDDIPGLTAAAHLVLCRSGASTIAEVTTIGRPAIYVPYPHATNNHQVANAQSIANAGGGWIIEQKDLTADILAAKLEYLLAEPCALTTAANVAASLGHMDAATKLADLVETTVAELNRRRRHGQSNHPDATDIPARRVPFQPIPAPRGHHQ